MSAEVDVILDYPAGGEGWQQSVILPAVPRVGDFIEIPEDELPGEGGQAATQWANDLRGATFVVKAVDWYPVPDGGAPSRPKPPVVILRKP